VGKPVTEREIYQQYTNTHRPNQKNTVTRNPKINCQTPLCLGRVGRQCHNIKKQLPCRARMV